MSTISQCLRSYRRLKKRPHTRVFKLHGKPQILTTCWKITFRTPKKPNSGKRRVAKCLIKSLHIKDRLTCRLNSYGEFPVKYKRILVRGGRANDTPGITYTGIRGAYDFDAHTARRKRRSLYGNSKPLEELTHIAKKYRLVGIRDVKDIKTGRGK